MLCQHCNHGRCSRPRGLCWNCYNTPGVRELYPLTSKFARRGLEDFYGFGSMPEPTSAPPGSPEKVAVLEERARRGQRLWHPLDAQLESTHRQLVVA